MIQKQQRTDLSSLPAGLAVGAGESMILTVLLSGLLAYLMSKETIAENSVNVCGAAILVLSAGIGALLAFKKIGHHRLAVCLASGGVYYLLLIACTALFFSGEYQAMGVTALAVLGGSGAAALLGLRSGKKGYGPRYSKYHNRKVVQNRQRGN